MARFPVLRDDRGGESRLVNRETSRLEFHARVLSLASGGDISLLERRTFCAADLRNSNESVEVMVPIDRPSCRAVSM